jgi:hypothetical protein
MRCPQGHLCVLHTAALSWGSRGLYIAECSTDKPTKNYIRRSNSGEWTADRLTEPERMAYKQSMGYKAAESLRAGQANS